MFDLVIVRFEIDIQGENNIFGCLINHSQYGSIPQLLLVSSKKVPPPAILNGFSGILETPQNRETTLDVIYNTLRLKSILIIGPKDVTSFIEKTILHPNFKIHCIENGQTALEQLRNIKCHMLIICYGIKGFTLSQFIKWAQCNLVNQGETIIKIVVCKDYPEMEVMKIWKKINLKQFF